MKHICFFISLLVIMVFLAPDRAVHAENPFFTRDAPQKKAADRHPGDRQRFAIPFINEIAALQGEIRQRITAFAREIRQAPAGGAMFSLLGLSMVYGILHALGPGHGKTIVFSYFLSRRGSLFQAVMLGTGLSFAHVLSATTIVVILFLLGKQTSLFAFHGIENRIETLSYLLIGLIGLFLLYKAVTELYRNGFSAGRGGEADGRSMAALSLSAGLIPCPGAAIILLFTLSQGILWAGLLAMIPLAAGMGVTASAVGMATIGSRAVALGAARSYETLFILFYMFFSLAGVLLINLFGWGLFFHAL